MEKGGKQLSTDAANTSRLVTKVKKTIVKYIKM